MLHICEVMMTVRITDIGGTWKPSLDVGDTYTVSTKTSCIGSTCEEHNLDPYFIEGSLSTAKYYCCKITQFLHLSHSPRIKKTLSFQIELTWVDVCDRSDCYNCFKEEHIIDKFNFRTSPFSSIVRTINNSNKFH